MRKNIFRIIRSMLSFACAYILFIYLVAIFSHPPLIGKQCLAQKFHGRTHDDYFLPGTKWIPWSATAFCASSPPRMLWGTQTEISVGPDAEHGPKPIPERGAWQLSLVHLKKRWPLYMPYFALTTRNGWHIRIGCRWDDIDHYYVFPSFALKRIG